MKNIFLFITMGILMSGCSSKNYILFDKTKVSMVDANRTSTRVVAQRYEYRIQAHDRLSITMYNHPELGTSTVQSQKQDTRGVLVDSSGNIRLPLIKRIHVSGLTQTQAQKKIEKSFGKYLEDAEVYLEVLNKRAYILGEVNKPGEIELFNEKMTLIQFIAKAGDFTDEANRQAIVIMKNSYAKGSSKPTVRTRTVDLTGLKSIKAANIMIYPNDVIYVVPNKMKKFNVGVKDLSPIVSLISGIVTPITSLILLDNNSN